MSNVPVIAFGPNEESFYVGLGMSYFAPNMPPSLQRTINKWPAIQINWLSLEADAQGWAAQDVISDSIEYSTTINEKVIEKLKASPTAEYISFGPTKNIWCTVASSGVWNANLDDETLKRVREIQASHADFDRGFEGILFGKGSTRIFMFKATFMYYTDKEAEGSELEKLMDKYVNRKPPWIIEHGSCLCLYNINYFFLKFKDPTTGTMQMHWNLPQGMSDKLSNLRATLNTPEAQMEIHNRQQMNILIIRNNSNSIANGIAAIQSAIW